MPSQLRRFPQPFMLTWVASFSLLKLCLAQIPNSDVGNYPSGVLTLIAASWLFFKNSTSTLYGMLPQYWLIPGLQTARKQQRDDLRQVKCCENNCYNGNPADINDQADKLRKKFTAGGINKLEDASKQILVSGSWSFSVLAEASDEEVKGGKELFFASLDLKGREKQWIKKFRDWEELVNSAAQRFWVYGEVSTPAELLDKIVAFKTVDAITIRVGSRRRTMDVRSVAALLTHSVAAAAARDAK